MIKYRQCLYIHESWINFNCLIHGPWIDFAKSTDVESISIALMFSLNVLFCTIRGVDSTVTWKRHWTSKRMVEFNSCQNYELLFLARIGQVPVGSKQKLENLASFPGNKV